jgi:cytochrome c biogenesis protein CcdA
MINLVSLGLFAGAMHVFSGPDHLAAVAPLSIERKRPTWLYGLLWGLGHASGVAMIGLLYCLFRESGFVAQVSLGAEKVVGLVLIWMGIVGALTLLRKRCRHEHTDDHGKKQSTMAFSFGILHGSAGANHLIGLLPLLALNEPLSITLYLITYCLGTAVAMAGFTHVFGRIAKRLIAQNERNLERIIFACTTAVFAIGGYWLIA